MKIENIKINGFGKLKNKEIDLSNGINLIYGENESGKSTLLKYTESMFYGLSKLKKGKEISEWERYKPWNENMYGGRIEYSLDNNKGFKIYRDFNKKETSVFNDIFEDISNEFGFDSKKESTFFIEQTGISEEAFASTLIAKQHEVKIEKNEQGMLIQKVANIATTGEDNVSYKKAVDKLVKRQLYSVGTIKRLGSPIGQLNVEISKLDEMRKELDEIKNSKYELLDVEKELGFKILKLEAEKDFFSELKLIAESEQIENEKIKVSEDIKSENLCKIKLLEEKFSTIQANFKRKEGETIVFDEENTKLKFLNVLNIIIMILILVITSISYYLTRNIYTLGILAIIPIYLLIAYGRYTKKVKEVKEREDNLRQRYDRIQREKQELIESMNTVKSEIEILKNNNKDFTNRITKLDDEFDLNINSKKAGLLIKYQRYLMKDEIEYLMDNTSIESIVSKINSNQKDLNEEKINLYNLKLEKERTNEKIDFLVRVDEKLSLLNEQKKEILELDESIEMAKDVLSEAYEEMKRNITPRFITTLSETISYITNEKYSKVIPNDKDGLTVEINDGRYVPISRLSIGTIDQLYLSLRLSIADNLTEEKFPILLDETFAYFDDKRLKNILNFLKEKYSDRQVILFTCTKREENILKNERINFKYIEM